MPVTGVDSAAPAALRLPGADNGPAAAGGVEAVFAELRASAPRADVLLTDTPAPGGRLAPYSLAFDAELMAPGQVDPTVTGRFVVLHDPEGQQAWQADTRVVVLVQAEMDDSLGSDPLLHQVTWSWLAESLETHGATWSHEQGTVTVTSSRSFGAKAGAADPAASTAPDYDVEVRASWSVADMGDLACHLAGFCDLLGAVAGVPAPLTVL